MQSAKNLQSQSTTRRPRNIDEAHRMRIARNRENRAANARYQMGYYD